jgi:hypothetical protein
VAGEDVEDRAPRRPGALRIAPLEPPENLPGAPAVPAVLVENQGHDVRGRPMGNGARRAAAIGEPAGGPPGGNGGATCSRSRDELLAWVRSRLVPRAGQPELGG